MITDRESRIPILGNVAMLRKFVALDWVRDHRPHIVVIEDDGAADPMATVVSRSWRELVTLGEETFLGRRDALAARIAAIAPGEAATYIYTSGTTGLSRGSRRSMAAFTPRWSR